MSSKDALKKQVCNVIDCHEETIFNIGDSALKTPELGFKEIKTAHLVSETMKHFQIPHEKELAVTGVKGWLRSEHKGPSVALMGELDALVVPDHPMVDKKSGAAHACGHNAQIAALMGAMIGLKVTNAIRELSGNVCFFAVPAEECVEIQYRMDLISRKKIGFLSGKQELLRLGHLSDIDMALMIHTHNRPDKGKVIIGKSSNGCVIKLIRYIGKAAHAGSSPHLGVNALNAANIGLSAIHAQRETFKDRDTVRIHPIITKGGDLVNIVPSEVCLETFVRGRSNEAIADAEKKVDRALRAGAVAMGAQVEIQTLPGYMPLKNDEKLAVVFQQNAEELMGKDAVTHGGHGSASTDMGDISHIMPALHPSIGGASGTSHGADYEIFDKRLNYISAAKLLAMTVIDLLCSDAQNAKNIISEFRPAMTREKYLSFQKNVFRKEMFDGNIPL